MACLTPTTTPELAAFLALCEERGVKVRRVGDNLSVEVLDLTGCTSLRALPDNLSARWLDLTGCTSLRALPDNLSVDTLALSGCTSLTALPDNLSVEVLYLNGCTSLTALPDNLSVYWLALSGCTSLTALSDNLSVEVLDLTGCTSLRALPDNLSVYWLDLSGCTSLTALPDNLSVKVLDLTGWSSLPECRNSDRIGTIHAPDADGDQLWMGRTIRLRTIDGFTMLIERERSKGDVTIASARYFGGGDISALRKCFIASQDDNHAHGESVETAMRDLRFKIAARDFDPEDTIAEIISTDTITREQFRLLTGACDEGLSYGLEQAGLPGDADTLPLDTALASAHGPYGEQFRQMIMEAR